MAAQQPFHGEPAPLPGTMLLNGLKAIGAAGGGKAAAGPDHRGDEVPIKADQSDEQRFSGLRNQLS